MAHDLGAATALETNHRDGVEACFGDVEVIRIRAHHHRHGLHALDAFVYAIQHAQAYASDFLIGVWVKNRDAVVVPVRHIDAVGANRHRIRVAAAVTGDPLFHFADDWTGLHPGH